MYVTYPTWINLYPSHYTPPALEVSTQDGFDFATISEAELRQTMEHERQLVLDARCAARSERESGAVVTLIGRVKSTARHVWGTL